MSECKIKCDACEEVTAYDCSELEWTCVYSQDRDLGQENEYEAVLEESCPCGQELKITFRCWEYPAGVESDSEIEEEGGEVLSSTCPSCPPFDDEEDYDI